MTVRKSASIDSLTASIQCASSMMNSAGSMRASDVVLISAVNRRRRASGSIWGSATSGVGDAEQIVEQQQILRVGVAGTRPRTRARAASHRRGQYAAARAQQPRHRMKRDVTGV